MSNPKEPKKHTFEIKGWVDKEANFVAPLGKYLDRIFPAKTKEYWEAHCFECKYVHYIVTIEEKEVEK